MAKDRERGDIVRDIKYTERERGEEKKEGKEKRSEEGEGEAVRDTR
jgi:hypothetical protein